jgi:3-hydroxyisobutyrate dehydrogenase-like beta-hydroxyacid dehydrogenase
MQSKVYTAKSQVGESLGVDLDRFRERLSSIQAKNKQIDERVNTELDRKFKKTLAGSSLKNQIQRYVE